MSKIFGIDLGTTYSCIAYVDEYGKATVVADEDNKPVISSVVYFDTADNIVVGDMAKAKLDTDPELVCSTVKRQMGNRDWFFEAHGKQFNAEMISSFILKKLAMDASKKLGEKVKDVVITCPAYFGMTEREATKNAGRIAGLNVLDILNEPTAAAISYGLNANNPETVLIYDLGGGTFDVTIIQVDPGKSIQVIATGGDHNLGGKDWDESVRGHIISQFVGATGTNEDDIYNDRETMGELELKAEKSKKELSTMNKTSVKMSYGSSSKKIEITREQFDSLTQNWLNSTIDLTNKMLKEAADLKGVTSYDKILLVGGSTRMLQVRERLLAEYPNVPVEVFDPDESVAKGAALYGVDISAYNVVENRGEDTTTYSDEENTNTQNDPFTLGIDRKPVVRTKVGNVLSKSFGVVLICEDGVKRVVNIIPKQSNIPTEKTLRAGTQVDNQTSVMISAYENEVSGENAKVEISTAHFLVEGVIEPLPPNLPKGSPIDITFYISRDGLLKIKARDVTGNKEINIETQLIDAMTEKEIEEAIDVVKDITII